MGIDDDGSFTVTMLADDVQAPRFPDGTTLTVADVTTTTAVLGWTPAEDNDALAEYAIFQDGQRIGAVPGDTITFHVTGLSPDTQYLFRVQARDAAGNNTSEDGLSTTATTLEDSGPPNLAGTWTDNGFLDSAQIEQDGSTLTLVNRRDVESEGRFLSPTEIVAWDGIHGRIEDGGNRIEWDNGVVWQKSTTQETADLDAAFAELGSSTEVSVL